MIEYNSHKGGFFHAFPGKKEVCMNKTVKKIWNILTTVLVGLVVLLALLLVGARVVGLQVFSVLSGSMEPTYHTGSLIYVKKVDPYTIQPGQAITFMLDENTVATHRVVGIVQDETDPSVIRFRTKGDANEAEDGSLVHYKNVLGEPVFTIPYLGYVANYIQNPPGLYISLAAGAVILMLVFIPDLFDDGKGKKKRKKKKKKKRKPQLDENGNPIPRQPKPQNSFPSDESLKNKEKEKQEL